MVTGTIFLLRLVLEIFDYYLNETSLMIKLLLIINELYFEYLFPSCTLSKVKLICTKL